MSPSPASASPSALDLLATAVSALGGARRPGQEKMCEAVDEALHEGHHQVVQAGTGTGKSLAYLVPSLRFAIKEDEPVIVSTATIALQRQLVTRDIPRLIEAIGDDLPRRPTAAILKGRSNYLCLEKLHRSEHLDYGGDLYSSGVGPDPDDPAATSSLADADSPSSTATTAPSSPSAPTIAEGASVIGKQVAHLHAWSQETETGDRDDLDTGVADAAWRSVSTSSLECMGAQQCPFGEECFAERARHRAQDSDLIVTNHSLLALSALNSGAGLPRHSRVVIDEAHELDGRITSAATAELSSAGMDALARRAKKVDPSDSTSRLRDAITTWTTALDAALATGLVSEGRWTDLPSDLAEPLTAVRDAIWAVNRAVTDITTTDLSDDAEKVAERRYVLSHTENLHDAIVRILTATGASSTASAAPLPSDRLADAAPASDTSDPSDSEASAPTASGSVRIRPGDTTPPTATTSASTASTSEEPEDVVWLEQSHRGALSICVSPLQISGLLATHLFAEKTVVLTSATLALGGRFQPMLAQWGLPASTPALDVGSPFDTKRNGIMYLAQDLPAPGHKGPSEEMFDQLERLIRSAGGRTLALFSSRHAAEAAAREMRWRRLGTPILTQYEDSLSSLVRQFTEDPSASLFGTLGLWQGVDVPGPSLSLVIMDRIPFPRPDDPLSQARTAAAKAAGRNGFMEVSATHAALLMAQGAGRLLRSVDDRGVVAILDSRIATKRYGSFLLQSMPPMWVTTNLDTVCGALERLDSAARTNSSRH